MTLDDDVKRLARIPLFAELDANALRLLAFSAEAKILSTGDVLFEAETTGDCGYVIVSGSLQLDSQGAKGRSRIARADALVGELALLVDIRRNVIATAREPTRVLKIARTLFRRVLEEFPDAAQRMRGLLARRMAAVSGELGAVSLSPRTAGMHPR